ncbi:MAG: hypothetical protein KKC18_03820 [Chloroflexi bacterium]|nr:hypothetical protein [Chloroflexota bacterium]
MKNIRWILVAAAAVLVLVSPACGGEDVEELPTIEAPPTIVPTNTPEPVSVSEGAAIEIDNDSGADVWYVYISPADADDWGDNWLGDDVIGDGERYVIEDIPPGIYDLKAEDENHEVLEVAWEMDVVGNVSWNILGLASLEIVNQSDDAIYYLYIVSPDNTSWGGDWLDGDVIETGDSYIVAEIPRGAYDVRATDQDNENVEAIYNISLPAENSWTMVGTIPLPGNAVLLLEEEFENNRNNWGLDVETENAFYMSPAGGEYCILIKSDNFTAWEFYKSFRTDEFVADVACRLDGAEDASCGLGFGPDESNIYWYEVSPFDQTFALFLLEDGEWQDNLVTWTVSKNIIPNGVNYLSMERLEGVVYLYINGVLVGRVDSDRFPTGRVGIGGSTYSEGNATVCLDGLRVWRLE